MEHIEVLSFVLNAILVVVVGLMSRESIPRIRKILDILDNGGYKNCPHFIDQQKEGRRWYDENNLLWGMGAGEMKGGEEL